METPEAQKTADCGLRCIRVAVSLASAASVLPYANTPASADLRTERNRVPLLRRLDEHFSPAERRPLPAAFRRFHLLNADRSEAGRTPILSLLALLLFSMPDVLTLPALFVLLEERSHQLADFHFSTLSLPKNGFRRSSMIQTGPRPASTHI